MVEYREAEIAVGKRADLILVDSYARSVIERVGPLGLSALGLFLILRRLF